MQPQDSKARGPSVSPFENAPDHPADPERDNAEQRGERKRLKSLAKARLGLVTSHQDHANHVDLVTKTALLTPTVPAFGGTLSAGLTQRLSGIGCPRRPMVAGGQIGQARAMKFGQTISDSSVAT